MDLKTLIEKLLTAAPPGAVVEEVLVFGELFQSDGSSGSISDIWYDNYTNSIVIQGE